MDSSGRRICKRAGAQQFIGELILVPVRVVRLCRRVSAAALATLIFPLAAIAEDTNSPFDHRFSLAVGGFVTVHDTNIRLDTDAGIGTVVNLEDDLGLDATTNLLRVDGLWRFAERHKVNFGLFDLSQSGARNLDKDLKIGEETFFIDEAVVTDWRLRLYEVGYSYRLLRRKRFDWWISAALFVQDTAITVQETASGGDHSTEDVVLPLPKFGTDLDYAFTDRWIGHLGIDVFALEIDDVGVTLTDIRATVDYQFSEMFSLGVGVHTIHAAVKLDRSVDGWLGRFDWEVQGLMLYGRLSW